MAIYERTPTGNLAAYNDSSTLPRKMRLLLKVVDGKTDSSVYAGTLESFGNVPQLLQSLQEAGMIQLVASGRESAAADVEASSEKAPSRKPSLMQRLLRERTDFPGSTVPTEISTLVMTDFDAQASTQILDVDTQQHDADTQLLTQTMADSRHHDERKAALAQCVEAMTSFVQTHVPQQASLVLPQLKQLDSLDQLAVMLGGYEQLVAVAGPAATVHISYLKATISEYW